MGRNGEEWVGMSWDGLEWVRMGLMSLNEFEWV
jgi:hypothetical protein